MKCKRCRKKISEFAQVCPYCQSKVEWEQKQIAGYEEYIAKADEETPEFGKRRKMKRVWIAVAAMGLAAVFFFGYLYDEHRLALANKHEIICYVKGNALVADMVVTGEKRTILNGIDSSLSAEDIGKIEDMAVYHDVKNHLLYYADGISDNPVRCYDLYVMDLQDQKKKPIMIGKEVRKQAVDRKGRIYFVTAKSAYLYRYDGKTQSRVQIPFIKDIYYKDGQDTLLAVTCNVGNDIVEKDGTYKESFSSDWMGEKYTKNFVLVDCNSFTTETKVEEYDGEYYYGSRDELYYLKNNQLFMLSLEDGEIEKLKDNVSWFQLGREGVLYYISYCLREVSYYDLVTDGSLKEDQLHKESEEAEYHEEQRKKLKNKKVKLVSGSLHCYKEGKSMLLASEVADVICSRHSANGYNIYFNDYWEKEPVLGCIRNGDKTDVYQEIEDTFSSNQVKQFCLYDYFGQPRAIPRLEHAFVILDEGVKKYSADLGCIYEGDFKEEIDKEEEEDAKEQEQSFLFGGEKYEVQNGNGESLIKTTKEGSKTVVADQLVSYQCWEDEYLFVLSGNDSDSGYTLSVYGNDGTKKVIEEQVEYLIG